MTDYVFFVTAVRMRADNLYYMQSSYADVVCNGGKVDNVSTGWPAHCRSASQLPHVMHDMRQRDVLVANGDQPLAGFAVSAYDADTGDLVAQWVQQDPWAPLPCLPL